MITKVVLEYNVLVVEDKSPVITDIGDRNIKMRDKIKILKVFVFCNLGQEEDLFYYIDKNIRAFNCKSIYKANINGILEEKIGDKQGVLLRYNDKDMIEIFDKKESLEKCYSKLCKEILKLSV